MGHVARAPWDMLLGFCCDDFIGHARVPWDLLQGLHRTFARVPLDMLQELPWDMLQGTFCEGSIGPVARVPWDMLRGFHRTCCEGSMGHVARAPWDMLRAHTEMPRWSQGGHKVVTRLLQTCYHLVQNTKVVTILVTRLSQGCQMVITLSSNGYITL